MVYTHFEMITGYHALPPSITLLCLQHILFIHVKFQIIIMLNRQTMITSCHFNYFEYETETSNSL